MVTLISRKAYDQQLISGKDLPNKDRIWEPWEFPINTLDDGKLPEYIAYVVFDSYVSCPLEGVERDRMFLSSPISTAIPNSQLKSSN